MVGRRCRSIKLSLLAQGLLGDSLAAGTLGRIAEYDAAGHVPWISILFAFFFLIFGCRMAAEWPHNS